MDARAAGKVLAALVVGLMALRERELSAALLENASARTVERGVREAMDEGFARIEQAFSDLDRPGGCPRLPRPPRGGRRRGPPGRRSRRSRR